MQIEFRLKPLLKSLGLDYHGAKKEMAKECKVHRHTITKLLHNEMSMPSLVLLSGVCRWIVRKMEGTGFDPSILPGALFGFRPTELWQGFGNSERVTIYLGEYQKSRLDMPNVPAHRSVSRRDAEVMSMFIGILSSATTMGINRPSVHTCYIPFQFNWDDSSSETMEIKEDRDRAMKIFSRDVLERDPRESIVLVGSQRVNYLLECLVADQFGCRPFDSVSGAPRVPFYLCYRDFDNTVRSCFGGRGFPPDFEKLNKAEYQKACRAFRKKQGKGTDITQASAAGTYYLPEKGKPWIHLPWKTGKEDAGIVMITRDGDRMEVAVFGFSGSATVAVGQHLIDYPWKFWPKTIKKDDKEQAPDTGVAGTAVTTLHKGREVAIYACKVEFTPKETGRRRDDSGDAEKYSAAITQVIPLPY